MELITFTEQDIGLYKTSILSRELKKRNSSLRITEINIYITEDLSKVKPLNTRFGVDSSTFKTYKLKSSIDPTCKYCGEKL